MTTLNRNASLIVKLEKSFEETIDRILLDESDGHSVVSLSIREKLVKKLSMNAVEIMSDEKHSTIASLQVNLKKQLVQNYLNVRNNLTNIFRTFSTPSESGHVELKEEIGDTENIVQLKVRDVYPDVEFPQKLNPIPVLELESSSKTQSDEKFQTDDSFDDFRLSTPDFDTTQKPEVQESQS